MNDILKKMGLEIERKFLVKNDTWKEKVSKSISIKQGYLSSDIERTVRVRIFGNKGFLTIKGKNDNLTRKEFEYDIPLNEAKSLLELCKKPIIEKTRFLVKEYGKIWEVDVFEGENEGLIIAEVELESENQELQILEWVGEEVSTDSKYFNSSLISNPFVNWEKK